MWRFLRRRRPVDPATVGFCERCGVVCDARCRADRLREQARANAVAFQAGLR
jgi:hypothetical protein